MVLRLRGADFPAKKSAAKAQNDDDQFESLDSLATKGLAEHVLYEVAGKVSIRSMETALVPVMVQSIRGERVLVFDPKASEVNVKRAVHLTNTTEKVLANGAVNVLEGSRFVAQCQFVPMVPGDDQLIELGEDTTVSVTRVRPQEKQTDTVVCVKVSQEGAQDGKIGSCKCVLEHVQKVTTQYSVKNNGTRRVPQLYVEHTARTDKGGFVIRSEQHCVKQVTGWARYCLAVEPEAEVMLEVEEEATYSEELFLTVDAIQSFVANRARSLQEKGVLKGEIVLQLRCMQENLRLATCLDTLARSSDMSEETLLSWEETVKDKESLALHALREGLAGLLSKVRELQKISLEQSEHQRQKATNVAGIKEIFENQARLRDNIRSMENVRTGTHLDQYLNETARALQDDESTLKETRERVKTTEEQIASNEKQVQQINLQISMAAKQLKKTYI